MYIVVDTSCEATTFNGGKALIIAIDNQLLPG